jgi:hypothetical protein
MPSTWPMPRRMIGWALVSVFFSSAERAATNSR